MVLDNGKIKCDGCGKFISWEKTKFHHVPDSNYTTELNEHYCNKCYIDFFEPDYYNAFDVWG